MNNIACIDLEGVLVPEMWPDIARATGLSGLSLTTREEPDYARLVALRIRLLRDNGIRLSDLQTLLEALEPLTGAREFLDRLRQSCRVVLVSDAFREMVLPLWRKLGEPELQCHRFECDEAGYIVRPHYARRSGKQEVLQRYQDVAPSPSAMRSTTWRCCARRARDFCFARRPRPVPPRPTWWWYMTTARCCRG
ncbi:bifunctional phosphoserine phosphatase/homoserine phosphotransferase ThrH [Neisseriaceae bacterium JH1-16]|nr:bifunctional phosphoserine phosphatase/homoserine phosphotransferase ThrH [Neisseriaceae bacterium JH1-16]